MSNRGNLGIRNITVSLKNSWWDIWSQFSSALWKYFFCTLFPAICFHVYFVLSNCVDFVFALFIFKVLNLNQTFFLFQISSHLFSIYTLESIVPCVILYSFLLQNYILLQYLALCILLPPLSLLIPPFSFLFLRHFFGIKI